MTPIWTALIYSIPVHFCLGVAHEEPEARVHLSCPFETLTASNSKGGNELQQSKRLPILAYAYQPWSIFAVTCPLWMYKWQLVIKESQGQMQSWRKVGALLTGSSQNYSMVESRRGLWCHLVQPSCTKRVTQNRMLMPILTLTLRVLGKAFSQLLASKPIPLQWKGFKLCRKESMISQWWGVWMLTPLSNVAKNLMYGWKCSAASSNAL